MTAGSHSGHATQPIRRIDVPVRDVKWSDSGELVAILSDQSFYVLRFARDGVLERCNGGAVAEFHVPTRSPNTNQYMLIHVTVVRRKRVLVV